jgi:Flp pilus assembly protein TadG
MRRSEGSVAVEFALISIPFVYLTIAIVELSLFFAAANMLEGGVNESARMIRTGQLQAQAQEDQEAIFREAVCDKLFVLINCENVQIEVVAIGEGTFIGIEDLEPVYDDDGNLVPREFNAGDSKDVVMIRASYRYQLLTPLFSRLFSKEEDHTIPLLTTVILQTEPYDFDGEEAET